MKKLINGFLLTAIVLFSLTASAKVYEDYSQPIVLTKNNPTFTIELDSNRTTGYSWYLISDSSDFLTLDKHGYFRPEGSKIGAGGKQQWTFTVKADAFTAPMMLAIKFIYARSWDMEKDVKYAVFTVLTE